MRRIVLALVGSLVALALATPSHASLNPCSAAKKKCVAKKASALLKCHFKDEKPPGLTPAALATCLQKAQDKFDGGATPAKGCFAKLEAKFPGQCLTINDTSILEGKVDAFVASVVCALDPGSNFCPIPTPSPTCPGPPPTPTPTSTPTGCQSNGSFCSVGSQCCSLICMGGMCQTPTCTDGVKNGNETGVDCGGGTCPQCPVGQGCIAASDCVINSICQAGQCSCAPGRSDCNGLPADGCEINVTNDPNNCSGCGNVCVLPNATESCVASMCMVGSCDPGFANCNGMTADGCEVNTTSDNSNCGFCGLVCPGVQNCIGSVCQ